MLIPLLISLNLVSCVTQRACYEKFPPKVDTLYQQITLYRDTTLTMTLPPDTVTDSLRIPVVVPFSSERLITETDYARAEAWVVNNILYQKLFHKNTKLEQKYDSLLQVKQQLITIVKEVEKPPEKTKISQALDNLKGFIGLVFLGLIITVLLLIVLKKSKGG